MDLKLVWQQKSKFDQDFKKKNMRSSEKKHFFAKVINMSKTSRPEPRFETKVLNTQKSFVKNDNHCLQTMPNLTKIGKPDLKTIAFCNGF